MELIGELLCKLDISTDREDMYLTALTHTSYSNEHNNCDNYERLEFLGDAVLELVVSDYLFNAKHLEEGSMTKMRACYVCEAALYDYALKLEFPKYVRVGEGIKLNDTILADMFEAFVGALYVDKGFFVSRKFILDMVVPYVKKGVNFLQDYKSKLQELVQTYKKSVYYDIVKESGPAHDKTFECVVKVDDIVMGHGVASSKKGAEQQAAKEALSKQAKIK